MKFHLTKLKVLSFVGLSTGMVLLVQKVYYVKDVLNNAFDTSILDVVEPLPEVHEQPFIMERENPFISVYDRATKFLKFVYARRVLNMAQCDNHAMRLRAVDHLATLQLENWQYSLLAHMCDSRTAVGLARTIGVNQRFFLPPVRKYGTYNNRLLFHRMKDYLTSLYEAQKTGHPCIKKVIASIFSEPFDENRIIDTDHGTEQLSNLGKVSDEFMPLCLESVRHHSLFPKYGKDIVNENGLYLMMEIYNRYQNNTDICISLCNILANISIYPEMLEDIYHSGWISVLAKWIKNPDIRISGPAAQALANLDRDDIIDEFPTNIYLLHPKHRSTEKIEVDVVFVHGLLGNVFYTWRNNDSLSTTLDLIGKAAEEEENEADSIGLSNGNFGAQKKSSDPATREYINEVEEMMKSEWDALGNDFEFVYYDIPESTNDNATGPYTYKKSEIQTCKPTQCWPRDWLPFDCNHLRVIGVNYQTNLSSWANICPESDAGLTIDDRSQQLLDNLTRAGVGKRPIVWVTHSMGGLLVKNALSIGLHSKNQSERDMCLNTKAIFFYSTPHFGSKTANLNQPTSYIIWPSTEVQELRENSPHLIKINNKFLDIVDAIPIKVVSFVENRPTVVSALKLNFTLVEPSSGNPGVGEFFEIPQNHLSICKPLSRESFMYHKVLTVVKEVVSEIKKK